MLNTGIEINSTTINFLYSGNSFFFNNLIKTPKVGFSFSNINLDLSTNLESNQSLFYTFTTEELYYTRVVNLLEMNYVFYTLIYYCFPIIFQNDVDLINVIISNTLWDYILNYQLTSEILNKNQYFKSYTSSFLIYGIYVMNLVFSIMLINFIYILRNSRITQISDVFTFKIINYLNNFSKNYRLNFQIVFITFFFILDSLIFTIMQSNNSNIEYIELIHTYIVYFILVIIVFLLYKYSIHYFSFLEQSVTEGELSSFIIKQFVRDLSNTFALFLRFFLLLFRLNIYDGLDDFLDSYCIFFAEFSDMVEFNSDCDMYLLNNEYSFNLFNDSGDVSIDDIDLFYFFDFLVVYYSSAIDSLNYWLFVLEEIFRLVLAIYIIYLIILEVHTINLNYLEENYFFLKK